jgi:hypothetical protein
MDTITPTMTHLFQQLGLPDTPKDIAKFIDEHRPLPEKVQIGDAPFWTPAQSMFVKDKLQADDHWAVVIDALNASLRAS